MKITDELLEHIAMLSQLELSRSQRETGKKDMEKMITYIDKLRELDTTNVEELPHVFPVANRFREDVVTNHGNKEQMLANAPEKTKDFFVVPKTIGSFTES